MGADKQGHIVESALTNGGRRTLVVSNMAPGARAPPHYHTDLVETFTLVSGGITVYMCDEPHDMDMAKLKEYKLEVGKPVKVPLNTLHYFVVPDEQTQIHATFEPGSIGFEKTLLIMDGLNKDGLYTSFSSAETEKGAMFFAIMADLTNTIMLGEAKTQVDQLYAAKGAEIEATKQELVARYASEEKLKEAAGISELAN